MARETKPELDRKAYRILIGCGIFIVGLISLYAWASSSIVKLDPESLCPKGRPIVDHTIILIDRTDPIPEHIVETIFREINGIKEYLPKYALLSIYQINSESAEIMAPEFCLCNPGNGDDESFLYKNPAQIHARWEKQFGQPLSEALDAMREVARSETSPIFEAIGVVGDLPGFRDATGRRQLVIYSDMLQNMRWCNHYNGGRYEVSIDEIRRVMPDLHGADIEIRYIERSSTAAIQGPAHQQHWQETLRQLGAGRVTVRRIVG